jgi:hypothetical protein
VGGSPVKEIRRDMAADCKLYRSLPCCPNFRKLSNEITRIDKLNGYVVCVYHARITSA